MVAAVCVVTLENCECGWKQSPRQTLRGLGIAESVEADSDGSLIRRRSIEGSRLPKVPIIGFAKSDTGRSRTSVSALTQVSGAGRARAMCDASGSTKPVRNRFAIKLAICALLSAKAEGACGSVLQGSLQANRRTLPQRPLVTLIGKYPLSAFLTRLSFSHPRVRPARAILANVRSPGVEPSMEVGPPGG